LDVLAVPFYQQPFLIGETIDDIFFLRMNAKLKNEMKTNQSTSEYLQKLKNYKFVCWNIEICFRSGSGLLDFSEAEAEAKNRNFEKRTLKRQKTINFLW
jgi:hypothetical protein